MAIYRLLEGSTFDPEDVRKMEAAYEKALMLLELKDRNDPLVETVARHIIEIAQAGVKDPDEICNSALKRLSIWPKASS
jgi:hypothetical protein